jgi:hypothetical protein
MNFLRISFLKNLSLLNYLLIFSFFIYSIYIIRYQYDGHHIGLVYSNAIDFINGRLPYKEIFIQYGFLTTLIHSLILSIFENKVFFISFFNVFFYMVGVLLISKSVNNLIDQKYALLSSIIILFNHPIPWLPWSNYLAFFFITISLYFLTKKEKKFFFISFFISLSFLCRQDLITPILISSIFFFIFYIIGKNRVFSKNFFSLILGFLLPILLFFIYLFFTNLLEYWLKYIIIPKYYLEIYDTSIIYLISNFIIYFSTESFFNFIYKPQHLIISIILIFNSILIFLKIFNKIKIQNNIFFIVLLSTFLSSSSLRIELFRLFTSVIIGLIPLLYFISKISNKELKYNLRLLVILPAIYCFVFYPMGNNDQFKKIVFNSSKTVIKNHKFDYYKWPDNQVNTINLISKLYDKCNVEYLENLTFDSLLSTVNDYNRIRLLPYEKAKDKNSNFHIYIDKIKNPNNNFIELINKEINKQNIILLVSENNNIYKNDKIKVSSFYNKIEFNQSDIIGRPKILSIYLPFKCYY